MNWLFSKRPKIFLLMLVAAWILCHACAEFYNIAWGTGVWLGQFSPKWALAFFLLVLLSVSCFMIIWVFLWVPETLEQSIVRITAWRDKLGLLRLFFVPPSLFAPVYLLQYTFWGYVIDGFYLRICIMTISVILLGCLLTKRGDGLVAWQTFLVALVLMVGVIVFSVQLAQVTDYPFSLGWSEGNRLWDYSIMFGQRLYEYPADKTIPVYLDVGRQFVGGIPFLLPGINIWQERLWLALMDIIPYLILGWVAFRTDGRDTILQWMLAGIWVFTFVVQGPIHPPLLLCAIIVALAWRRPIWIAATLVAAASFFATVSRFTWLFAPAMWAVMLEFSGAATRENRLDQNTWKRAITVGVAGIAGGFGVSILLPRLMAWMSSLVSEAGTGLVDTGNDIQGPVAASLSQGLLWYRLLPNETYGQGILIGLLLAVAPLVLLMIYLMGSRRWLLNGWQKSAIVLPLLAFLVVGLIVSTKIGGGGDLHNLDMFIIGLLFAGALAWRNGGRQWLAELQNKSFWARLLVTVLVILPGYWELMSLKPIAITGNSQAIAILSDVSPMDPLPDPLPNTLPSEQDVLEALNGIRAEVERTAAQGETLFMDQRQLLTFGYITGVALVPEYDKKVLIDKALSGDAQYFTDFYNDLAARRFSLIISNPLHEQIKTNPAEFGEENNAWVKWVSTPILCYYEPLYTLKKVKVQILAPRPGDTSACALQLP